MIITSTNSNLYEPIKMIVFYKQENETDNFYSEISEIENGEPKSFRPFSEYEFKSVADIIMPKVNEYRKLEKQKRKHELKNYSFSKIINRQILSFKNDKDFSLVWFVPAHENNFILDKKIGRLHYPNLIFKVKNKKLYVFSCKRTLNENTVIYKVPFPNFYDDGSMCFGNMNINKLLNTKDLSKIIENMENAVFNSSYNILESENRTLTNTFELLKHLSDNIRSFPSKQLVKQPKTRLKDVISK